MFYLLEAQGLEVWLVNAKDVKHLPGRPKTDKLDFGVARPVIRGDRTRRSGWRRSADHDRRSRREPDHNQVGHQKPSSAVLIGGPAWALEIIRSTKSCRCRARVPRSEATPP